MSDENFVDLTSCPTDQQLAGFAAGRLSPRDNKLLAKHLDQCPACQTKLAVFKDAGDTFMDDASPSDVELSFTAGTERENVTEQMEQIAGEPTRRQAAGPPRSSNAEPARAPKQIGEYQLLERLGEGGMGAVYKAQHASLGTVYAVKLLHSQRTSDRAAVERFQREMIAIGRLDHPNIVRAVDGGEEGEHHYLVMEFVDGVDLSQLGRRGACGAAVSVADGCELIRQAAVALDYAHRQGRVHRDVKPSNLMLASDGAVKLLDLGLARLGEMFPEEEVSADRRRQALAEVDALRAASAGSAVPMHTLTFTNQVMGTLEYMAPEQASDARHVDARADIYSLGCTLYKLLAGRAPFADPQYSSAVNQIQAHIQAPVPPIGSLRPDAPEELAAVIDKMLAKKPDDRFQSAAEVAGALEPFAVGADLQRLLDEIESPNEREASNQPAHTVGFGAEPVPPVVMPPTPKPASVGVLAAIVAAMLFSFVMCGGFFALGLWMIGRSQTITQSSFAARPVDVNQPSPDVRLDQADEGAILDPTTEPAGEPVDLLELIDVGRDGIPGAWRREGAAIVSKGIVKARLQLPYLPPADYQIRATIEELAGKQALNFGVVIGGRQCLAIVDGWPLEGYLSGPQWLDGKLLREHKRRAWRGRVAPIGRPVELVCTVRSQRGRAMLRVEADGREIFTWRGKPDRLSLQNHRKPPLANTLFLDVVDSQVKITQLEVTPLAGGGKVIEFADADKTPALAAAQRVIWKGGKIVGSKRGSLAEVSTLDELEDDLVLTAIDARGSPWFSAEEVRWFSKIDGLKRLNLSDTGLYGRALGDWSPAADLEELNLARTDLRGWRPKTFPALRNLNLSGALFDAAIFGADDDAKATNKRSPATIWPQLESLDLSYTTADNSTLTLLGELQNLTDLTLDFTLTSDEGINRLLQPSANRSYKRLSLMGVNITSASLAPLATLENLEKLNLLGAEITPGGLAQLRAKLGNCQIDSGDQNVDLIQLVAASPHVLGPWSVQNGRLVSGGGNPTRLALPITPPEEYDLQAVVRRNEGRAPIVFQILAGGRPAMIGVDHWPGNGYLAILHGIDGRNERDSQVQRKGKVLTNGRDARLLIRVRRGRITLLAGGLPLIDWEGDFNRLRPYNFFGVGASHTLGVSAYRESFTISRLALKPISGVAKVAALRPTPRDSDRIAAQVLHEKGARLTVTLDGKNERVIEANDDLPSWPFWVGAIDGLGGVELSADDFASLGSMSHLRDLRLSDAKFNDENLKQLAVLNELLVLHLSRTGVTDAGLAHLAGLDELSELELSGTNITAAGLEPLTGLPRLRGLYLSATKIGDEDLPLVARFRLLWNLSLSDSQVTTAGLAKLKPLSQLTHLYLSRIRFTSAEDLAALADFKKLRALHLDGVPVDDEALRRIARLQTLRNLRLPNTAITDQGMVHLSRLKNLQRLNLIGAKITDKGVVPLRSLKKLRRLSLPHTDKITDASVEPLTQLTQLQELDLYGTKITSEGVARLRSGLPAAAITAPSWQSSGGFPPVPPEAGSAVDLLALVDLDRDAVPGTFQREGTALVSRSDQNAFLQLPYAPPPEYRITATVERLAHGEGRRIGDGPTLGVVVGDRRCWIEIDNWLNLGGLSGPMTIDGKSLEKYRDKAYRGQAIPPGQAVEVVCTVRNVGRQTLLRLDIDGREIFTWQGKTSRLNIGKTGETPTPDVLFLRIWRSKVRFTKLEVTPLGMPGRIVKFADPSEQPDLAAAQRVQWKGGEAQWSSVAKRLASIDSRHSKWFGPSDLAWMSNLKGLQRLSLSKAPLRREHLAALTNLPKLEVLRLPWCEIPPNAATELVRFPHLRRLDLAGARLDDEATKSLAQLSQLEELDLSYAPLTDEGLKNLRNLAHLSTLRLDHTNITDQGIDDLAQLPKLRFLSLNGTMVSNDASPLAAPAQLDVLQLLDTGIAAETGERLRQQLPNSRIVTSFDRPIDLLPLVDLDSPSTQGAWRREAGKLHSPDEQPAFAAIPMTPPDEYDVELVAQRESGRDGLALLLFGGARQFLIEWDHAGRIVLVDMIDGKRNLQNESAKETGVTFESGRPVRVGVQVRRDRIRVLRAGRVVVDWPADYNRLSLAWTWRQTNPRIIGVGAFRSRFVITQLKLTPLSGPLETVKTRPTARTSERDLAQWTLQNGGEVVVTYDGLQNQTLSAEDELLDRPLWVVELKGLADGTKLAEEDFSRIAATQRLDVLNLRRASFDEEHLAKLTELPALRALRLSDTSLSDEGLRRVAQINTLQRLYLEGSNITSEGVKHLERMRSLRQIWLHSTAVTDSAVETLAKLPALTHVDLAATQITGRSLGLLAACPNLHYLRLNRANIEPEYLEPLPAFSTLRMLFLDETPVGDEGAKFIAQIARLTDLSMASTPLTDTGLEELELLTKLRKLNLTGAKVSDEGVKKLRAKQPKLEIEIGEQTLGK